MTYKCHSCGRMLPNRSRRSCQYCGAVLADEQRIATKGRQFLERLKADETKKHREFMERDIRIGGDGIPDVYYV